MNKGNHKENNRDRELERELFTEIEREREMDMERINSGISSPIRNFQNNSINIKNKNIKPSGLNTMSIDNLNLDNKSQREKVRYLGRDRDIEKEDERNMVGNMEKMNSNTIREKKDLKSIVKNRLSKSVSNFNNINNIRNDSNTNFLDCYKNINAHEAKINCILLYKDRENNYIIATGGQDRSIKLWDYLSGKLIQELKGHLESVTSLAKIKRKEYLISSSEDNFIKIWNYNTKRCIKTLEGHTNIIKKVIYMKWEKNESTIISASFDKTIRIWNFESEICHILKENENEVISLVQIKWLRDNCTIASGSWREIKLWNIITGENFATYDNNNHWIRNLIYLKNTFSNKGDYIVSSSNNEIKLWDLKIGKCVNVIECEDSFVGCIKEIKLRNKEMIIASGGSDNSIKLWNVETSKLLSRFIGHTDIVKDIAQPNKNDEFVLLSVGADRKIKYWK
jgi:WD40 repeat protein